MIAAKMATLKQGQVGNGRKVDGSNDLSTDDAAAMSSVSAPTVKRAKHVLEHGSQALIQAERRLGELLAEMEKHVGGRPTETGNTMLPVSLSDLGISNLKRLRLAYRWLPRISTNKRNRRLRGVKSN